MKDNTHQTKPIYWSRDTASPSCPNPSPGPLWLPGTLPVGQIGQGAACETRDCYHFGEGVHTSIADPLWGGRAVQPEHLRQARLLPRCVDGILNGIKHWGRQEQRWLSHSLDRAQARVRLCLPDGNLILRWAQWGNTMLKQPPVCQVWSARKDWAKSALSPFKEETGRKHKLSYTAKPLQFCLMDIRVSMCRLFQLFLTRKDSIHISDKNGKTSWPQSNHSIIRWTVKPHRIMTIPTHLGSVMGQ